MNILEIIAHQESGQVEDFSRAQARAVYLGNYLILCRTFGKYLMVVDGRDNSVAPHLLMDGFWEMPTTRAIARYVKPGMACVDVGANFGYFTVLLAHLVGDGGSVEAFEPNDMIRECLRRSTSLNGLGSVVRIWPSAVSERKVPRFAHGVKKPEGGEFAWLRVPETNWGSAELVFGNQGHGAQPVDVMRLDDEHVQPAGCWPDFVKIDAEGFEPEVWASMDRYTAQKDAQMAVCLEWAPWRYDDAAGFLDRIAADGFGVRRVLPDGRLGDVGRDGLLGETEEQGLSMVWAERSGKS